MYTEKGLRTGILREGLYAEKGIRTRILREGVYAEKGIKTGILRDCVHAEKGIRTGVLREGVYAKKGIGVSKTGIFRKVGFFCHLFANIQGFFFGALAFTPLCQRMATVFFALTVSVLKTKKIQIKKRF